MLQANNSHQQQHHHPAAPCTGAAAHTTTDTTADSVAFLCIYTSGNPSKRERQLSTAANCSTTREINGSGLASSEPHMHNNNTRSFCYTSS